MCRWLEDAGATAGTTVIAAARKEALATAFCLSNDATGVAVQPIPTGDRKRQPCRHAHFFVQIADRDHALFEFTPRETSAAVGEMFKGFGGYVQALPRRWSIPLYPASLHSVPGLERIRELTNAGQVAAMEHE
jgi:transposase